VAEACRRSRGRRASLDFGHEALHVVCVVLDADSSNSRVHGLFQNISRSVIVSESRNLGARGAEVDHLLSQFARQETPLDDVVADDVAVDNGHQSLNAPNFKPCSLLSMKRKALVSVHSGTVCRLLHFLPPGRQFDRFGLIAPATKGDAHQPTRLQESENCLDNLVWAAGKYR
jgi:hypothetical protein